MGVSLLVAIGAACQALDGTPTAPPEAEFKKVGKPGGGGGSGNALTVAFVDPVTLGGSASADYTAPGQSVGGSNGRNSLRVTSSPYTMTIDIADEIAAKRASGECEDPTFDALGLSAGPVVLEGQLGVHVDKRHLKRSGTFDGSVYTGANGVAINFTVSDGTSEYFLTTGSGAGTVNAMNVAEDRFSKLGGFLRINVDGQVGPICQGIVDYEFTAN